jgi:hypothetical protein
MRPDQSAYERRVQVSREPSQSAPSRDDVFLPAADEADFDDDAPKRGGVLGFAAVVVTMAAVGAGLGVVWHNTGPQLWAGARWWPAFASQSPPAAGSGAPEQPLDRIARELAALKASIGELGAAQQQMAASIAALQAAQQQLRAAQEQSGQRPGTPPGGPAWFSSAVTFGSTPGQNPAAGATPQQPRAAAPRPNAQAPTARAPNASAAVPRP